MLRGLMNSVLDAPREPRAPWGECWLLRENNPPPNSPGERVVVVSCQVFS